MIDLYRIYGDYTILATRNNDSGTIYEKFGEFQQINHYGNVEMYESNLRKEIKNG